MEQQKTNVEKKEQIQRSFPALKTKEEVTDRTTDIKKKNVGVMEEKKIIFKRKAKEKRIWIRKKE